MPPDSVPDRFCFPFPAVAGAIWARRHLWVMYALKFSIFPILPFLMFLVSVATLVLVRHQVMRNVDCVLAVQMPRRGPTLQLHSTMLLRGQLPTCARVLPH